MSNFQPLKHSPTRSMNRGDSNVEKFGSLSTTHPFHKVLREHGYKNVGGNTTGLYRHPDGHEAHVRGHYGGPAMAQHMNKNGKNTNHSTSTALHQHLTKLHGSGTKLSVSAGAAMDPGLKKK